MKRISGTRDALEAGADNVLVVPVGWQGRGSEGCQEKFVNIAGASRGLLPVYPIRSADANF